MEIFIAVIFFAALIWASIGALFTRRYRRNEDVQDLRRDKSGRDPRKQ